ncbi:MAG TPA: CRISPR-associated helicase Cas3' [Anaerolineae bacterium]|nr:CRISPR-associated helicase Cas3' [Anaerolineae bacterium]
MTKERASNKSERLLQIEALLLAHPEGLSQAELARRVGVNRSQIHRDLPDLKRFSVYEMDDGRLAIDRDHYLTNVHFTLHEALAMHLAARLMATSTDKQNPHAAAALRKLGLALEKLAPLIATHLKDSADVMEDAARYHDPVYLDVLETLTRAWSLGRKVSLKHQLPDQSITPYTFAPYFVEPYAVGQSTHAIGWREPPGALRTFKVERIRAIKLLDEPYTIPAEFDARALLADAWGIWYTEQTPVTVRLRFHPHVAARVQETHWHRSAVTNLQPDGYLLWEAQIAEPREMLPWIRGWGASCLVLEPASLREALMQEAAQMGKIYSLGTDTTSNSTTGQLLRCWGKTKRYDDTTFHPVLFHMLDVGHVAQTLLTEPASPRWRKVLADTLGVNADTLIHWLPYVIAMHDIGKLTTAFQTQNDTQYQRLKDEGFPFDGWKESLWQHHTFLGQAYLQYEQTPFPLPESWRELWRDVVGGHHGKFGSRQEISTAHTRLTGNEPALWHDLRVQADLLLRQQLLAGPVPTSPPSNLATATIALTGFTILCDWLGSDEKLFAPLSDLSLTDYIPVSIDRARRAVHATGFCQPTHSTAPLTFAALFPDKQPARPLQAAVDAIPEQALSGPALVIIEAPTGEGKTEAALAIAHRLAQANGTDALYYALPTTATSNQMFGRLREHLDERLNLPNDVQLIHGQAHLREDDLDATPLNNGKEEADDAIAWFTSKKRAILAPFGVGTVDQAELAALNVKHVALRLMGLAGKVVIFDEVHAYDTYMTTIIERLLEWLSALGSSVIILSATLPQKQRAALVKAYGATLPQDTTQVDAYPSLLVLPREGELHTATPEAYQTNRPLKLEYLHWGDDDTQAKAQWLMDKVKDGGCACWITNTVARAQDMYNALRDMPGTENVALDLLHARFPFAVREQRENRLKPKYGPPPKDETQPNPRPHRAIVIGTQVLEQSLDFDFDVMVSDLAPIDLLLQRAGRLQRHSRPRPAVYADGPTLWINAPLDADEKLDLGVDTEIYAEYLLRQTWLTLENYESVLNLPHDYRPLVEAVYREDGLVINGELANAWDNLHNKRKDAIKQARQRIIADTRTDEEFYDEMAELLFEEDETGASWIVAQTRLGRESVNLIPLVKLNETTAHLFPHGELLHLNRRASPTVQRHLLQHHMRVSRPEIVRACKQKQGLPALFTQSSRLSGYYPLWLNGDGTTSVPKLKGKGVLTVKLDDELGLIIK